MAGTLRDEGGRYVRGHGVTQAQREAFLAALATASNVTKAAEAADVHPSTFYRLREQDATFEAQWRTALDRGYEEIEADLISAVRGGESGEFDPQLAIQVLGQRNAREARGGPTRRGMKVKQVPINEVQATIMRRVAAIRKRLDKAQLGEAQLGEAEPGKTQLGKTGPDKTRIGR